MAALSKVPYLPKIYGFFPLKYKVCPVKSNSEYGLFFRFCIVRPKYVYIQCEDVLFIQGILQNVYRYALETGRHYI